MASLRELMAAKKKSIGNGNFAKAIKPPSGTSRWRILPGWRDPSHDMAAQWWHDFGQHFIKDAAGTLLAVYACDNKTYGKDCECCDSLTQAIFMANDDKTKERLKEMQASQTILVNALRLDGADANRTKPVLLSLGPRLFGDIMTISEQNPDDEDENFDIITDVTRGVDIIITREGTGLNTKYTVNAALTGSKPVDPTALSNLINLDEYVAQSTAESLQKARLALRTANVGLISHQSAPTSSDDEAFEDAPNFPPPTLKAKQQAAKVASTQAPAATSVPTSDDILDGEFETVAADASMSDDDLDALLASLD